MSSILEALRRSEAERRQGTTPIVPPTPTAVPALPPHRLSLIGGIVLLFVGAILIGYFWLKPGTSDSAATSASTTEPSKAAGEAVTSTPAVSARNEPPGSSTVKATLKEKESPSAASSTPKRPAALGSQLSSDADTSVHALAEEARVAPTKPKAKPKTTPPKRVDAPPRFAAAAPASVPRPYADVKFLRAMPPDFQQSLPALAVTIHIYSPNPAEQILYINNRQYQAGDKVQGDLAVEAIVEDGAVLSFRGQRFKLPRPS